MKIIKIRLPRKKKKALKKLGNFTFFDASGFLFELEVENKTTSETTAIIFNYETTPTHGKKS